MREHVEETVGNVAGKDRGRIGAAAEAHCQAYGIATKNGRKKESGEESAEIALGTGGKNRVERPRR